jgi:hypothetical protein
MMQDSGASLRNPQDPGGLGKPVSGHHPAAAFGESGLPGSNYAFFVQFPHPGREHHRAGQVMSWNKGQHGRKFLLATGRYVDAAETPRDGTMAFWGEWEPPSEIVTRWNEAGALPRVLHRPFWFRPTENDSWQNTDPWVFGDRMIFSNCRQATPRGRPSAMQSLTRGSVVCFGSAIAGKFCVDTVMVIARVELWAPASGADLGAGDAFQTCTASLPCGDESRQPTRLSLYRGATIDDPLNGMYSFVPALPANQRYPRFARPAIELPGNLVSPARQSPHRSYSMPPQEIRGIWEAIRRQVLAAGLMLAVRLDTPPYGARDDSDEAHSYVQVPAAALQEGKEPDRAPVIRDNSDTRDHATAGIITT